MATMTEEELRKIILDRLYYWIEKISGKPITIKKREEAKEILDQVIDVINKKRARPRKKS